MYNFEGESFLLEVLADKIAACTTSACSMGFMESHLTWKLIKSEMKLLRHRKTPADQHWALCEHGDSRHT